MTNDENTYAQLASASLAEARCLPFKYYRDKAIYQLEKRAIFHSDWVFACAADQLANHGDYFAFDLAEEPVIIVRGKDNKLRALSNVCRHRGTPLLDDGFGHTKRFVCPYHAWTYSDKGELLGAPHTHDDELDKSAHCLSQFKLEVWQGLVFVSLNPDIETIQQRFAGIEKYLAHYQSKHFLKSYTGNSERWACNWKLAMENAMESYHLFKVHRETLEHDTPTQNAFYLEGSALWTLTAGKYASSGNKILNWLTSSDEPRHQHYILVSLPPSFVGILTHESFDWISILPEGEDHCVVRSAGISETGEDAQGDELEFTQQFFKEDKLICERVQRGMRAEHSQGGKLVDMERIVVDFHNYLGSRISGRNESVHYASPYNVFFGDS